ncbi:FG-GAP repeat [Carpediemonas membranifera]|uniref:FG-GAP repeat n=1 Tax=Carpediemonas membranifera TaxID=201153 RepID=A0A8J6B8I0_9EUKA|nr:FG-GAP repeat [Carpediemonas membranifera]|eukprot:KAG9394922.1 FG-GAP repeat [Carpediemonas membranifera]
MGAHRLLLGLILLIAFVQCFQSIGERANDAVLVNSTDLVISDSASRIVSVYVPDDDGLWTLKDSVSGTDTYFGYTVDATEDFIVTSSYYYNSWTGRVFVYQRGSESISGPTIIDAPSLSSYDRTVSYFGQGLSIDGNTLAISSPRSKTISSSSYRATLVLYSWNGNQWTRGHVFTPDSYSFGGFGRDTFVVRGDLVFYRWQVDNSVTISKTDGTWVATIDPPASHNSAPIAVSDSLLAISYYSLACDDGARNCGAVYVYDVTRPSAPEFLTTLKPGNNTGAYFGYSLDADGDILAVGARQYWTEDFESGAAFTYQYDRGSGTVEQKLAYVGDAEEQYLGSFISTTDATILVGSTWSPSRIFDYSTCAAGYGLSSTGVCEMCPAGFVSGAFNPACVQCPLGQFQPEEGQTSCLTPDDGYYVPPYSRAAQAPCPDGYVSFSEGWTCVDPQPARVVLNTTSLSYSSVPDEIAVDSEIIAVLTGQEQSPLLIFDHSGNLLGVPDMTSTLDYYRGGLGMTSGHIFIATTRYEYNSESYDVTAVITIFARTDIVPTEINSFTLASAAGDSGLSQYFASYSPAAFQNPTSGVSTFVVGDGRDSTYHEYAGRLVVVTADGDSATGTALKNLYGTKEDEYIGFYTSVDASYIYASTRSDILNVYSHDFTLEAQIQVPCSTSSLSANGTHLAIGCNSFMDEGSNVFIYSTETMTLVSTVSAGYLNPDGHRDGYISEMFGRTVALCGTDHLLVGDPDGYGRSNIMAGFLYIYQFVDGEWVLDDKVPGDVENARFGGQAVGCSGSLIAAGQANYDYTTRNQYTASAQVFPMPLCPSGTTGNYPACELCPPGTYSPMADSLCLNASAGFHTDGSGTTTQIECADGYYQPNVGQGSCLEADPGFYVYPGDHTQQVPCASGHYSAAGNSTCTAADAGHYVPDSNRSQQLPCPAGTFQPMTGKSSCSGAEAGYYVNADMTAELPCDSGTYQPEAGQPACLNATTGHYVPADGQPHVVELECAVGTFANETGTIVCPNATAGHYVANPGQSDETPCAAGTYQPASAQTSCIDADAGHYALEGAVTQTPCRAGTYQPHTRKGSCYNAPKGSYVARTGATTYEWCAQGMYQTMEGQTSCITATAGYYVDGFHTKQTPCDNGSFQPLAGQSSCNTTAAGYYTLADGEPHTAQLACNNGTYQPDEGQAECLTATPGHYVPDDREGHTAQESCLAGTYQANPQQASCAVAEVGYYVAANEATAQVECETGKYQNETGMTRCFTAESGYYVPDSNHAAQLPCNAGMYQPGTGSSKCFQTRPGYFTPADGQAHTGMDACAAGSYQDLQGQACCTPCGLGSFASTTASTTCTLASAGFFSDDRLTQQPCATGFFQPERGQSSCLMSEAGFHSAPNHTIQVPCDAGKFQNKTGQTSCIACPEFFSTPADGQPHTECVRWVPEAVIVSKNESISLDTGDMNSTVSDVTFGDDGDECQLVEREDGSTIVVPVVRNSTVPAGNYSTTIRLSDGTTETVNVEIEEDYTIPEAKTVLRGKTVSAVVNSTICPASMAVSRLVQLNLTAALSNGNGVQCEASTTITADDISSNYNPRLVFHGGLVCLEIDDAEFGSTDDLVFVINGEVYSTLSLVDAMPCSSVPLTDLTSVNSYVLLDSAVVLSSLTTPPEADGATGISTVAIVVGVIASVGMLIAAVILAVICTIGGCVVCAAPPAVVYPLSKWGGRKYVYDHAERF